MNNEQIAEAVNTQIIQCVPLYEKINTDLKPKINELQNSFIEEFDIDKSNINKIRKLKKVFKTLKTVLFPFFNKSTDSVKGLIFNKASQLSELISIVNNFGYSNILQEELKKAGIKEIVFTDEYLSNIKDSLPNIKSNSNDSIGNILDETLKTQTEINEIDDVHVSSYYNELAEDVKYTPRNKKGIKFNKFKDLILKQLIKNELDKQKIRKKLLSDIDNNHESLNVLTECVRKSIA